MALATNNTSASWSTSPRRMARPESPMRLHAPSGDELMFRSLDCMEELGQPFEFDVEAASTIGTIKPEDLLGKPASVSLDIPSKTKRYFHGLVCAMGTTGTDGRHFGYRMTLRPWVWLLT